MKGFRWEDIDDCVLACAVNLPATRDLTPDEIRRIGEKLRDNAHRTGERGTAASWVNEIRAEMIEMGVIRQACRLQASGPFRHS